MRPAHHHHAIITGGTSGIGKATAHLLVRRGMHLSLIARNEARLEQTRAELEAHCVQRSQHINAIIADVADRQATEDAVAMALARSGAPTLAIMSAGTVVPGHIVDLPVDVFERTMAVNYLGTLYVVKAVLPAMREQRRGHLVLISSGAGLLGVYGYTAYSASKFALRGFAEALRAELKPDKIGVSIVYPPDTDTPQLAEENRLKPDITKRITAGGGLLSAEQVARAIVRGIDRRRFAIAPGLEMTLLARLGCLLAPRLHRRFDRIIRRYHS
jgi:3-dehydrosphinganine reductase